MHAMALRLFLLIAACVVSGPALAGVGGTSAGVTSNIPGQSTDPSADVQAQSAGFVQQNQQLQNGAAPNGIAIPGSAIGTNAGQATTANVGGNGESRQKPGDPAAANAQPAAPHTPPPPPPTYVSVVKHLTPQTPDTDSTAKPVVVVPAAVAPTIAPTIPPPAREKAEASPTAVTPVPDAPPHAAINRARMDAVDANAPKNTATDRAAPAPVAGGRGDAPDGFAFYAGLGVALLLLAVALAAYLRAQRDEAAIRSPRG